MHSHADTREHCLLRDTKKATMKQIVLECMVLITNINFPTSYCSMLDWAKDSKPNWSDCSLWNADLSLGSLQVMQLDFYYLQASDNKRLDNNSYCADWWHRLTLWLYGWVLIPNLSSSPWLVSTTRTACSGVNTTVWGEGQLHLH